MSEKIKRPYGWKKESLNKDDVLTQSKRKARLATAALILSLGLNVELATDHKPSKALFDYLKNRNTSEESISGNAEHVDSKVITINQNEILAVKATEAFKELADQNNIDKADLPYDQIQAESREAQSKNNEKNITYPDDKYITELSKTISGVYSANIEPVDK